VSVGDVHGFLEREVYSQRLSDEAGWQALYRRIWPDLIDAIPVAGGPSSLQRQGVDRVVRLPNGRSITIDEKKRDVDFGDMLVEVYSRCSWDPFCERLSDLPADRKIGWTLDPTKVCDYVAYAILPAAKVHMLPFDLLRRAARRRINEWRLRPGAWPKVARSSGLHGGEWSTLNLAVPWDVLWAAMRAESESAWSLEVVDQPVP